MCKKKVVSCNGCFDGVHPGHFFFLGYARALGDKLIVGINSDDYICKHKREQPFFNEDDRVALLLNTGIVDEVHVFNEETPDRFLRNNLPDIHCTGEENGWNCPERDVCDELGIQIFYAPRIRQWATSNLTKEESRELAKRLKLL